MQTFRQGEAKFVEPPHELGPFKNVMDSPLARATPFHQVTWKSSQCLWDNPTYRQTNLKKKMAQNNIIFLAEVIMKAVGVVIAKYLRPYSVITDSGFCH